MNKLWRWFIGLFRRRQKEAVQEAKKRKEKHRHKWINYYKSVRCELCNKISFPGKFSKKRIAKGCFGGEK